MTRINFIFALIAGALAAGLMWLRIAVQHGGLVDIEHGMTLGYATMIIALSLVFFGIKSYRDNHGGHITFLKGLQVGILISLVCAICYAASWELYYRGSGQEFLQKYTAHYIDGLRKGGSSDAEVTKAETEMAQFQEMYKNFFVRFGFTLMEIVPVGIIVTLISALLLRKRDVLPATPD
jgi:hypothetical protein